MAPAPAAVGGALGEALSRRPRRDIVSTYLSGGEVTRGQPALQITMKTRTDSASGPSSLQGVTAGLGEPAGTGCGERAPRGWGRCWSRC